MTAPGRCDGGMVFHVYILGGRLVILVIPVILNIGNSYKTHYIKSMGFILTGMTQGRNIGYGPVIAYAIYGHTGF